MCFMTSLCCKQIEMVETRGLTPVEIFALFMKMCGNRFSGAMRFGTGLP
jgi:hypothetical protein